MSLIKTKGRGAGFDPPNRFEPLHIDRLSEDVQMYFDIEEDERKIPTQYYLDTSKTILAKNDSPDLGFDYSINPYRGCEHGCIYCYARPSHEYLGFSSGIDFEIKIMVKLDAAKLLEDTFISKKWQPQMIMFSGNTDCYQPLERNLKLTRQCLRVFLNFRNPLGMITKNALITRDIDILKELAALNLVCCTLSVTSLKQELTKKMEPRTSSPMKKLKAVEELAKNNIPVGINIAPIIPGLNDEEIPSILKAASEHGALWAGKVMLRLPFAVKDLFVEWLKRELPEKSSRVLNRIMDVRDGKLSNAQWGERFRGSGQIAESIHTLFKASCKKYHLNEKHIHTTTEHFRRYNPVQPGLF